MQKQSGSPFYALIIVFFFWGFVAASNDILIPVFKEKGYGATSISDIATACGLLKGSLYHHFSSKDELMSEVLQYLKEYADYDFLMDVCGVDYPTRAKRFDVVYHLFSSNNLLIHLNL